MKTYRRYVVNHTYPEDSISECFLLDEAMMYAMNYMPDGTKGSHKQGRETCLDDDRECAFPIDKKGKIEYLENVQYQQARKWVLRMSTENVVWEEKYDSYVQEHPSQCQPWRRPIRTEKPMDYIPWL